MNQQPVKWMQPAVFDMTEEEFEKKWLSCIPQRKREQFVYDFEMLVDAVRNESIHTCLDVIDEDDMGTLPNPIMGCT